MTNKQGGRKGKAGSKAGSGKLRLKKETVKDLDAKNVSKVGGFRARSGDCDTSTCVTCTCITCLVCPMAR